VDSSASVARWLTLHRWTFNCTALTRSTKRDRSSHIASERTTESTTCITSFVWRHRACVNCGRSVANGCTRRVSWHLPYCCVRASPSNGWCLESPLSNGSIRHNIVSKRLWPRKSSVHSCLIILRCGICSYHVGSPHRRTVADWVLVTLCFSYLEYRTTDKVQ
jgi:hypothetical protein